MGGEIDIVLSPDNAAEILGSDYASRESITIPNGVTMIRTGVFEGNTNLKSITIPKSVSVIDGHQFKGCKNLEKVTFSNAKDSKLIAISEAMFEGCTSLKTIEIPAAVKDICYSAFNGCSALKTVTFNLYNSLNTVEKLAFSNCASLTSISLPNSVKTIGEEAFSFCVELLNNRENPFVIPANVKILENKTFYGCKSLQALSFATSSECEEIGEEVFAGCEILSAIELPRNLKKIGKNAFSGCTLLLHAAPSGGLTGVVFENTRSWFRKTSATDNTGVALDVTDPITNANEIPKTAEDSWLQFGMFNTAEPIPSTMTEENANVVIGNDNWKSLENIVIPEGVAVISGEIFKDNTNIKTVTLPKSLQRVPDDLFNGCTNLEKVTFNNPRESQLANISNRMFKDCAKLTEIEIPAAVKEIGVDAFNGCTSLKKVTFNPYNATETIGKSAFENCTALVNLTLPASLRDIGEKAFSGCTSLVGDATNQLIIPLNITKIEAKTFYACKFQTLAFATDSKCTEIGESAFENCDVLAVAQLPKNLEKIGANAFKGCSVLAAASESNNTKVIFEKTRGWKDISGNSINVNTPWQNSQNITGTWLSGIVNIGGEVPSVMTSANATEVFDDAGWASEESLEIPEGVTMITDAVFLDNKNIKTVTLPKSLQRITANSLFEGCTSLQTVTFSTPRESQLVAISTGMFNGCTNLTEIEIPAAVKEIGVDAFNGCTSLKKVTFNSYNATETIGKSAFENCTALVNLTLPASLRDIGEKAFSGCTSIIGDATNQLIIPLNITKIEAKTFYACKFQTLAFATDSKCTEIGESAFENCDVLAVAQLPKNLEKIGIDAFKGCSVLAAASETNNTKVIFERTRGWKDISGNSINVSTPWQNAKNIASDWLSGIVNIGGEVPSVMTKENAAEVFDDADWASKESLEIPEGVTMITDAVFQNNTKIKTVTLPKSLQRVSVELFNGCANLQTVIFSTPRESQLVAISNGMFNGCTKLTEIEIPAAVKEIGESAFLGCSALKKVTFNSYNATETIGANAFKSCTALTSISLPGSLRDIGEKAFSGCTRFVGDATNQLIIPANVEKIKAETFYACKFQTLVFATDSKCTEIEDRAFENCDVLAVTQLPKSLEKIGANAFKGCSVLSTATETNGVKVVFEKLRGWKVNGSSVTVSTPWQNAKNIASGNWCTYGMTNTGGEVPSVMTKENSAEVFDDSDWASKESLEIPEGVTMITDAVFLDNKNIKTVTLPKSLQRVSDDLFNGCTSLQTVTFSTPRESQLVAISTGMFNGCTKLTEIEIPATVKEIGENAFLGCSALKKVTFNSYNYTETIGACAFLNCTALTSISLPSSLKNIGEYAFSNAGLLYTMANPFVIPALVEKISSYAFGNCKNLGSVGFAQGSKLKTIEDYAFSSCSSLKEITIPEKCNKIGKGVFSGYSALTSSGANGVVFENLSYWYTTSDFTGDTVDVSDKKNNAKKFTSTSIGIWSDGLYRDDNKVVPQILTSSNVASVLGSGWQNATTITIPDGVEIIQDALFKNNTNLTKIYFAQSVAKVANSLCSNCTKLETVEFADGCKLDAISPSAFNGCTSLKSIRIPAKTTEIGEKAFYSCTGLQALDFENNSYLRSIGNSAFDGCTALIRMAIPSTVVSIGEKAYCNCENWQGSITTTLEIPDGVEEIGYYTFFNCKSLTTIYIGKKVKKIGERAFDSIRKTDKYTDGSSQSNYTHAAYIKFLAPEGGWQYKDSNGAWQTVDISQLNKTESHGNGKNFDWNGERFQSFNSDGDFDGGNTIKFWRGMEKP